MKQNKGETFTESEVGALIEHVDGKFGQVIEGYAALDKKIDKQYQELCEFRGEVNYKFDIVFDELHVIRNELKEKIGRDEFQLLEKRVAALEKRTTHKT